MLLLPPALIPYTWNNKKTPCRKMLLLLCPAEDNRLQMGLLHFTETRTSLTCTWISKPIQADSIRCTSQIEFTLSEKICFPQVDGQQKEEERILYGCLNIIVWLGVCVCACVREEDITAGTSQKEHAHFQSLSSTKQFLQYVVLEVLKVLSLYSWIWIWTLGYKPVSQ